MPRSALAQIRADLERHRHAFDLDRGLGEKLMDATAEQIARDMADETGPDGARWAPLSPAYAAAKAKAAPGRPIGVRDGLMASEEQLRGLRRVTATEAVMVYGTDERARDEATHFQEAGRPFYGISAEREARLDSICTDHLESQV